ncbi:large subunit GTPase 1 homolog [Nilaparvata lugens]|uniref:large subunit GTPase 1 homolog n=1 Tax=Nilaparvata lugens TaxID=108931 RepID=UPI00193DC3ED|nr:large subunit GTPase 1 homolog [Nilaparvata lugens]
MGKKGKSNVLGRALIKDKLHSSRGKKSTDSILHTAELGDGYDWACLNVKSVTEEDSLQEFLSTAELAGTEFQAEKLNIKFVNPKCGVGLLSKDEKENMKKLQQQKKKLLKIPRRPEWNSATAPEELHLKERESFLEWRRSLAMLQEDDGLIITPYEKNLDFWRQLWRVVERSDIVVQILDARNPLLFRCQDLEKYVKEVSKKKENVLLLNKSDFLTKRQRQIWASHFDREGTKVAFFSAKQTTEANELGTIDEESESKSAVNEETLDASEEEECIGLSGGDGLESDDDDYETESESEIDEEEAQKFIDREKNSPNLLGREELIAFLRKLMPPLTDEEHSVPTVGLVGYPNVGKSSTINALLQDKKTSVSATPGKTKHFQTLFVDSDLMLCDCPGLVMPSFVYTKADLIVNGILPIDQMRDHVPAVNLVCSLLGRPVLEHKYGIMVARPGDGDDPHRPPTSEELLNAYAYSRGFMTQNGQPDNPRSSRYILKDFVNGQLLFCHAPPGVPQADYHTPTFTTKPKRLTPAQPTRQAELASKPIKKISTECLDKQFFKQMSVGYHSKGTKMIPSNTENKSREDMDNKSWKNHKEKRNKREKLRRVYRHLDE